MTENKRRSRPTLRDVGAMARVDPSAVSRVINNDPNLNITPQTRARILDAVEKLGYRTNVYARGLRVSRTWTIGFVVPDIGNPVYVPIIEGAQRRAEELGYGIVIGSQRGGATDRTFLRLLREGRVDGLLIASGTMHDDLIRSLAGDSGDSGDSGDGGGRVVLVNRRVDGFPCSVVVDDAAGSHLATTYLLDQGHREIGALIGPPNIDTSRRRRAGFRTAIRERGGVGHVVSCKSWTAADGYNATSRLVDRYPDITAIFPSTLLMAFGTLRALGERGVRVPEEMSVVALHDSDLAAYTTPPLTTVAMPTRELGSAAIDLLLEQMREGKTKLVFVPGSGQLIARQSVTAPR